MHHLCDQIVSSVKVEHIEKEGRSVVFRFMDFLNKTFEYGTPTAFFLPLPHNHHYVLRSSLNNGFKASQELKLASLEVHSYSKEIAEKIVFSEGTQYSNFMNNTTYTHGKKAKKNYRNDVLNRQI